jgi:hypothetical protein
VEGQLVPLAAQEVRGQGRGHPAVPMAVEVRALQGMCDDPRLPVECRPDQSPRCVFLVLWACARVAHAGSLLPSLRSQPTFALLMTLLL